MRLPENSPSTTVGSAPCTMNRPSNGSSVASIRSRYSTIAGPMVTSRMCATA